MTDGGQSQDGTRTTLRSILPNETLPRLHPDQALDDALRRLGDWPLLPVVNRANFRKLEGVVSLTDILQAYREAGPSDLRSARRKPV